MPSNQQQQRAHRRNTLYKRGSNESEGDRKTPCFMCFTLAKPQRNHLEFLNKQLTPSAMPAADCHHLVKHSLPITRVLFRASRTLGGFFRLREFATPGPKAVLTPRSNSNSTNTVYQGRGWWNCFLEFAVMLKVLAAATNSVLPPKYCSHRSFLSFSL